LTNRVNHETALRRVVWHYDDDDGERTPREEEGSPLFQAFVDGRVATLHDWDNGVHYRDASLYGIPEGKLLPKRAPTVELKNLLRERRQRAGLSVDLHDTTDDF